MWITVASILLVLLLISAIIIGRKKFKNEPDNVVSLSQAKKAKTSELMRGKGASQKCSHCKQPSKKLAFYATPDGRVIGVCPSCKPAVERQGLLPI